MCFNDVLLQLVSLYDVSARGVARFDLLLSFLEVELLREQGLALFVLLAARCAQEDLLALFLEVLPAVSDITRLSVCRVDRLGERVEDFRIVEDSGIYSLDVCPSVSLGSAFVLYAHRDVVELDAIHLFRKKVSTRGVMPKLVSFIRRIY